VGLGIGGMLERAEGGGVGGDGMPWGSLKKS